MPKPMEQIDDEDRNLEWKEKCDDIPTLCDADVFPAVDHCPQEEGLHRHFHPESSVWLDGNRLDSRAGLGLRERRAAAGVCYGWPGTVLWPVRRDDRGRSFLPELCPAVVSRTNGKSASEMRPSPVIRAILSRPRLLQRTTMGVR
jgi:hypothetical protein